MFFFIVETIIRSWCEYVQVSTSTLLVCAGISPRSLLFTVVRVGVVFVLVLLTLARAAYKYAPVRSWYCNNGARCVLESWFVEARFIFCLPVTT